LWNKFAQVTREAKLAARADRVAPKLADLAAIPDEPTFRARFSASPIKRTGRDRFVRNVLVAIGNSGDADLARVAEERIADASPLVRGAAAWALGELAPDRKRALAAQHASDDDVEVRSEWLA
jgi:epoxyqueuosine reductase